MKTKLILVSIAVLPLLMSCTSLPVTSSSGANGVNWKLFPDPRSAPIKAGEEIVFQITPFSKKSFTLHYGDSGTTVIPENKIQCASAKKCSPLMLHHIYAKGQAYYPYIIFNNDTKRLPTNKNDLKIIIARKEMKTDEQVEQAAIDHLATSLVYELDSFCRKNSKGCNTHGAPLAIAMLKDANFESRIGEGKKHTIRLIKNVTTKLLDAKFNVLEKQPQALIRLAHEAVTDKNSRGRYLSFLDYSLQTSNQGGGAPILYSIKVEGINDVRVEVEKSSDGSSSSKSKSTSAIDKIKEVLPNIDGSNSSVNQTKADKKSSKAGTDEIKLTKEKKVRPVLLAKFKTAKYLLVLDELKHLKLTTSPEYYYSEVYQTPVAKRKASLTVSARLLDRTGEILWIKDIATEYTDQLSPNTSSPETVIPISKLYRKKSTVLKDSSSEDNQATNEKSNNFVSKIGSAFSSIFK